MFCIRKLFFCCSAAGVFLSLFAQSSLANKPVWSKKAVSFRAGCDEDERKECKPLKIFSPDRNSFVKVSYEPNSLNPSLEIVALTVVHDGKPLGPVGPTGSVENEIVWAPDSKAFFINGSNNANGDYHFAVYRLVDSKISVVSDLTANALQDVVRSFPPCRAKDPSDKCEELAADPDGYIGTAAIDWLQNSSAIVIMAEVTCSSSMGGIMCAVLGYELDIPSGKILRRMEPKEFARRWQHSMAWKFHDPGPPEFNDKQKRDELNQTILMPRLSYSMTVAVPSPAYT